jgi:capsular polysaccharide biosynthesis protein
MLAAVAADFDILIHRGSEPLSQQLQLFARASIVIAPHGAALVFLLVTSPDTTVIEFSDVTFHGTKHNRCFCVVSIIIVCHGASIVVCAYVYL